jgi:hypothetical protein
MFNQNIVYIVLIMFLYLKSDILVGTWNVRSLYRAGSLTAVAMEIARYKLDLVGGQEIRWDKGGSVRAGDYNYFYGK